MYSNIGLRWSCLLDGFAREFTDEDVRRIKQFLSALYPAAENPDLAKQIEKIEGHDNLFYELQKAGLVDVNNTKILRHILGDIEISLPLLRELNEFEEFRDQHLKEVEEDGAASVSLYAKLEPFVGREKAMSDIDDWLHEGTTTVRGVCIAGLPGMGKTRLAREACVKVAVDNWKIHFVDLKGKDTIEAIIPAILNEMDLIGEGPTLKSSPDEERARLLRAIKTYKKGKMVLWLDNVDKPLEPDMGETTNVFRSEFIDFLEVIVGLKNSKVKIIITTRFGLEEKSIQNDSLTTSEKNKFAGFLTIRLDSSEYALNLEEACQYILDYSNMKSVSKDDARSLARQAGMNPLLMKLFVGCLVNTKVTARDLVRSVSSRPADTLTELCKGGYVTDNQIEDGFRQVIDLLREEEMATLLMLTVIPGSFTIEAAANILGEVKNKEFGIFKAKNKIGILQLKNLVETSDTGRQDASSHSKRQERYTIHFLIRTFVRDVKIREDATFRKYYDDAEERYVKYYMKKMNKLNSLIATDFKVAVKQQEEDATNMRNAISLIRDKAQVYKSIEEVSSLEDILDILLNPTERYLYFKKRSAAEKQIGNMVNFAKLRSSEVVQLSERGHGIETLCPMVEEALTALSNLPAEQQGNKEVELAYTRCYHCMGDIFFERDAAREATKWLAKAKEKLSKFPDEKDMMVNILTSISVSTHKAAIDEAKRTIEPSGVKQALKYAKQAYDLRVELSGSELHYETPTIIQNMAAFHHDLRHYDEAVDLYKHALKILNDLKLAGTTKGFSIMKNIATSYRKMKRFDDALVYAKTAMEGRKELLGDTPYSARSVYMVGAVYMELEKYTESKKYLIQALEMEERLWRSGKPHSCDWDVLQDRLFTVCEILEVPETEILEYKRRVEEAEDISNHGKPAPRREFKLNEDDSSSDEEEVPRVDIRSLVTDATDLKSLLQKRKWDVTDTGNEAPTVLEMTICMGFFVVIAVVVYHVLYGRTTAEISDSV